MALQQVSKYFWINAEVFCGMVPPEAGLLFRTSADYPIYLKPGFLTSDACDEMLANIQAREGKPAEILVDPTTDSIRVTQQYLMSDHELSLIKQAFETERGHIEEFFEMKVLKSEGCHALGYFAGGHYRKHSDNCRPIRDKDGEFRGFECIRPGRQLSSVVFLTDSVPEITGANQCVGGNLSFPNIVDENDESLLVEARKGLMAVFPSSPYYSHQVNVVYQGYRVTIVDWYNTAPKSST